MVSFSCSRALVLIGSLLALSLWASPVLGQGRGQVRRLPTAPRVQPLPAARGTMMTPNVLPRTRSLVSPFSRLNPGRFSAALFFNPALANSRFRGVSPFAFRSHRFSPLMNAWLGTPGSGSSYGGYGGGYGGYGSSPMYSAGASYSPNYGTDPYSAATYGNGDEGYGYNPSDQASYAGAYPMETQQGAETTELELMLTAIGVPNDQGQVSWPLGFRLLRDKESTEVKKQLEGLVQVAAIQGVNGQSNPRLLKEGSRVAEELRALLYKEEGTMPLAVYQESARFLARLQNSLKALQ
jgi:hypothetical protein